MFLNYILTDNRNKIKPKNKHPRFFHSGVNDHFKLCFYFLCFGVIPIEVIMSC